jgi:GntR family transcriptional regulator
MYVGQGKAKLPKRKHSDEHHITVTSDDMRALSPVRQALNDAVINPESLLPAYLQLAILLRATIVSLQLPVGTMLPSEPELTERYKVSRDTVRKAMQLLREHGLAETRRGIGHFVVRTPEIRRVVLTPGSRVVVRMTQPGQNELLALVVYVVTEPGKEPVVYDSTQTMLVVED